MKESWAWTTNRATDLRVHCWLLTFAKIVHMFVTLNICYRVLSSMWQISEANITPDCSVNDISAYLFVWVLPKRSCYKPIIPETKFQRIGSTQSVHNLNQSGESRLHHVSCYIPDTAVLFLKIVYLMLSSQRKGKTSSWSADMTPFPTYAHRVSCEKQCFRIKRPSFCIS